MKFLFLVATLFASFLLAGTATLTPSQVVLKYQKAMNSGDMSMLAEVTVESTFDTNMEVYSLSIALGDKVFAKTRKAYANDEKARQSVIKAVATKLKNRKARKISNLTEMPLGGNRMMVRYIEDGKKKQLYLSLEKDGWKVNYLAGRKI